MHEYAYDAYGELIDITGLYDDALDGEGEVEVAGLTFYPSRIIEELDPIAYRCGFNDYMDSLYCDGAYGEAIVRVLTEDGEVESVTMFRETSDADTAVDGIIEALDMSYIWTVQVVNSEGEVTHERRVEA